ncbi:hypothetical protein SY88_10155 [Clostridiales bacterium PH28_bin88]|nr:hypothetical protein SY88_10155 [Clostridiales bacterium PH28_bin88]
MVKSEDGELDMPDYTLEFVDISGILNFWFYEDEEIYFADGRLLLRGANGAGKTVTMQSLIPLVLDGDKRPWCLDPFGSKDRKIEYYLLGEGDGAHINRTGYLYLEFYHPQHRRYVTIGIGLRARKNARPLFWGFAVTDNRRVGKDFNLFDTDYEGKRLLSERAVAGIAWVWRVGG